jgi:hypothetical protein
MAAEINTANTFLALGRNADAELHTEAAVALGAALVADFPDVHTYRSGYALALNQSCYYAFGRKDLARASELLETAVAQQEHIARGRPADVVLRIEMGVARGNLALIQLELGEAASALATTERGLAHFAAGLERVPGQTEWQRYRDMAQHTRARALVALGRWQEVRDEIELLVPGEDATQLERRAELLERCARLAASDDTRPDAAREVDAAALRTAAIDALRRVTELGEVGWAELADPDAYASLRDAPEFVALVEAAAGR